MGGQIHIIWWIRPQCIIYQVHINGRKSYGPRQSNIHTATKYGKSITPALEFVVFNHIKQPLDAQN